MGVLEFRDSWVLGFLGTLGIDTKEVIEVWNLKQPHVLLVVLDLRRMGYWVLGLGFGVLGIVDREASCRVATRPVGSNHGGAVLQRRKLLRGTLRPVRRRVCM